MKYRKDIDGLRAVSVLSVVFYHGAVPGFSGGFVGVDVFFVISGFLITGIIVEELDRGAFSLAAFYERRVRRLGPALLAVAACVVAFNLAFKTPRELDTFGESISFFGLLASNHFFAQERGYFDVPRETFALLHTWSLAVEEQFYLAFPLILIGLTAWARRWRFAAIAALAAVSFVAASVIVAQATADPTKTVDAAFYFAPLRAWELALGALLALARPVPDRLSLGAREGLAWLGLALVLAPVAFYDHATPFPGPGAAPPCLGAALLLYVGSGSGAATSTTVGRALSWRPAVFVGLTSYSFYLWHWPALSFASYVAMRELTLPESLAAILLSFLISIGSLYFIERPFRRPGGVAGRRTMFGATALALIACIALGGVLQRTDGLPQRYSDAVLALTTGDSSEFGVEPADCEDQHARLTPEARRAVYVMFCKTGDLSKTPTALLWGDSHALSISPAFAAAAKARGESILVTSRASCPPIVGYEWKPLQTWRGCKAHNEAVFDSLESLGIERIYLFAAWGAYAKDLGGEPTKASTAEFAAKVKAMLARLADKGVEIVIGGSVPVYHGFDIPSVMHREALFGRKPPVDVSREAHERHQDPEKRILQEAAAAAGAPFFALDQFFCDAERCIYSRDGLPLYADHGHVNLRGAAMLTDDIGGVMDHRVRLGAGWR